MIAKKTPPEEVLSHVKGRIGEIYIEALSLSHNLTCQNCKGGEYDSLGIDYLLFNYPQGVKRNILIEDGKQINLQVKGTSISSKTMLKDKSDHYLYTLSKSVYKAGGIKTYLIVICIPEEEIYEEWIQIEPEKILLFAKAYYYEVMSGGLKEGNKIKIPKSNILDKNVLFRLFD